MNPNITPRGVNNPFTHFCMTIGAIPTSYKNGLDYYETLLWLIKFLENKVIPAVDNNAAALTELQSLFVTLKDYVTNYFDNLDVQEEINNKLDEMVEQGTLQEIIADYLNSKAIFGFDTISDLKTSTNLIDGSYARTLGYYEVNDGGGALYKITTDENLTPNDGDIVELESGLLALLVPVNDEIFVEQFGAKGDNETDDSTSFQNALNSLSTLNINKINLSPDKQYYINSVLTIFENTTLDLNNSTIRGGQTHIFFNFKSTKFGWDTSDTYTGYNGNGNITIKNGCIKNSSISFIHGENILLKNLNFFETNNNHYLEICACKNYHVLNCNFIGMKEQPSDRQFVEYIQIDSCDYISFPWLEENSPTYDDTLDENITIENCTFRKSEAPYNHLYTAIGNHVVTTEQHNGINILNNIIEGIEYRAIRLQNMKNILIDNNNIIGCLTTAIGFNKVVTNVKILNNYIKAADNVGNVAIIIFHGTSDDSRHSNIEIKNNTLLYENTTKGINPSYCDNIEIAYNLVNTKRVGVIENTTNVTFAKNESINSERESTNCILNSGGVNSIRYTDIRIPIGDVKTNDNNDTIYTLLYPITDFNKLIVELGFVGANNYQMIEINTYEDRLFELGEKYLYSALNNDGSISIYRLEIDETDNKKIKLVLVSGTLIETRQIYAKSI